MSIRDSCRATALSAVCAAALLVTAPCALADGADSTVAGLQAKGYDVRLNWLNGFDTEPLSACTVTDVDNPDRSGAPMKPGDTVYVDVQCPNHPDE